MSDWYAYLMAASFGVGVMVGDSARSWWCAACFVALGGFAIASRISATSKRSIQYIVIGCIMATIGCLLVVHAWEQIDVARESIIVGKGRTMGRIVVEPDRRENGSWYVIDADTTRIRIFAPSYPAYQYGDVIDVVGVFELPESFSNDAGIPFDYPSYLATNGITHVTFRPRIDLVYRPESSGIVGGLIRLKASMATSIARGIESPQADLVIGMLLGIKRSLGEDLLLAMQKVGLVHLVVLSGFNVSIIILALKGAASPLPSAARIILMTTLVAAFVVMIGASASVVRAAVMAMTGYLAESLDRRYDPLRALFVAAAIMVAIDPLIVMHDPGFQLSFLATVGVITIATPIKRWCIGVPDRFGMRDGVAQTIAAQTMTLPVIMSMTGSVSVWSIPANALVVPLVAPIMLFGAIAMALGFVASWLQAPAAWIASALASGVLYLVDAFARL